MLSIKFRSRFDPGREKEREGGGTERERERDMRRGGVTWRSRA